MKTDTSIPDALRRATTGAIVKTLQAACAVPSADSCTRMAATRGAAIALTASGDERVAVVVSARMRRFRSEEEERDGARAARKKDGEKPCAGELGGLD